MPKFKKNINLYTYTYGKDYNVRSRSFMLLYYEDIVACGDDVYCAVKNYLHIQQDGLSQSDNPICEESDSITNYNSHYHINVTTGEIKNDIIHFLTLIGLSVTCLPYSQQIHSTRLRRDR